MGEIAAAAATQVLIDVYHVDLVVNFGVAGALTDEMTLAENCIVEKIIHYDFDLSGIDPVKVGQYPNFNDEYLYTDTALVNRALRVCPTLKRVTCASADKCYRNHIPCIFIKAISDSLTGGGKEYYTELLRAASLCLEVTDKVIKTIK